MKMLRKEKVENNTDIEMNRKCRSAAMRGDSPSLLTAAGNSPGNRM
jgi:hypothetical protein